MLHSLNLTAPALSLAVLGVMIVASGCSAKVQDHDRACPDNLYYDDFTLAPGDPAARLDALEGVTEVVGDLSLSGEADSLEALSCLTRVHGDLKFRAMAVPSFEGLQRLAQIDGSLTLADLGHSAIDGFEQVQQVDGLHISTMPNLRDVDGLSGLRRVTTGIFLRELPAVEDLSGLSGITELSGELSLEAAAPLAQLALPLGEVFDGSIVTTREVADLTDAVAGLRQINGSLVLTGGSLGADWSALVSVGDAVTLSGDGVAMPDMRSLQRVRSQLSIDGLQMQDMSALASLEAAGGLSISQAPDLETLDGLQNLRRLVPNETVAGGTGGSGGVVLSGCESLVDLSALGGLVETGNNMTTTASLFRIRECDQIADLQGTKVLAEQADFVSLTALPALVDLRGWSDLVAAPRIYAEDTGLRTLEGLSLTADATFDPVQIELYDNLELTDIGPLIPQEGHSIAANGFILISGNPKLRECQAQSLVDAAQAQGFAGNVALSDLLQDGPCE